jgi:hypothetical protein
MDSYTKLNFENELAASTRVLIVNPVYTNWSYFLTSEVSIRSKKIAQNVKWVNIATKDKRHMYINRNDYMPRYLYRNSTKQVAKLLESLNIEVDSNFTRLIAGHSNITFNTIEELRNFRYKNINLGAMLFSSIASSKGTTSFGLADIKELVEDYIVRGFSIHSRVEREISEYLPDLILTTNDRLMGSALTVLTAKELNIPYRIVYFGSQKNKIMEYSTSLYSTTEWQKNIKHFWINTPPDELNHRHLAKKVDEFGSKPTIDSRSYLSSQIEGKTIDLKNNTCVFYAQSEHEHSAWFIDPRPGAFNNQYKAFNALQEITKQLGWHLILKYHPVRFGHSPKSNKTISNVDWQQIQIDNSVVQIPSDSDLDTYSLINNSDINIVWSSTVGLESIARGKKTLVLGNPIWLDETWGIHAWSEKNLLAKFHDGLPLINKSELNAWIWFSENHGSRCEYVQFIDDDIFVIGKKIIIKRIYFKIIYFCYKKLTRVLNIRS